MCEALNLACSLQVHLPLFLLSAFPMRFIALLCKGRSMNNSASKTKKLQKHVLP